jgi:penicillin-binding protein 1C
MKMKWLKVVGVLMLATLGYLFWFASREIPKELLAYQPVTSLKILARDGSLLREMNSSVDGKGTPIDASILPAHVKAAFYAAEDKDFEHHLGVSISAIGRAFIQNIKAKKVVSGGSTITQQLARNLVPRERSLSGKIQEALWALRLEFHLTKNEILSHYLNRASFGNGVFGIEAAAQMYFGKKAKLLSLGQASMLAAMLKSPTGHNPYRKMEKLERRRQWVLRRISVNKSCDTCSIEEAKDLGMLDLVASNRAFLAPHFVEFVKRSIPRLHLESAVTIETTLDPKLQVDIEQHVFEEVSRLHDRQVSSAAALVLDNHSNEVLAYVGSADFFDESIGGQNDGITMKRQPGSALKPFIYAEAFRQGLTPASVIPDLETSFEGRKGAYAPKNYDRRLHGPVRAREALANSYNVPAVRVANSIGIKATLDLLHRAGFESLTENEEHYGLGLALGNGEVSLFELARAYSGLAGGGFAKNVNFIRRALDANGNEIPISNEFDSRRFADEKSVSLVNHILSDNSARARAFGLDNALRLPFPVAAKTGTSKGYSDNWTVGFTKEKTVAVWAGNFDGTPMVQVSGITGAGPIFRRTMQTAMSEITPAPMLDSTGLERIHICPLSGQRATDHCPSEMEEWFIKGTAPIDVCPMHKSVSKNLPENVKQKCLQLQAANGRLVDLGLEYYDWAKNEGLMNEPWMSAECLGSNDSDHRVTLLHPMTGDEFLLLSDLPRGDQAIPIRVQAHPSIDKLFVVIDGVQVTELRAPFTGRIPATKGKHELEIKSAQGNVEAHVQFVVREESRL